MSVKSVFHPIGHTHLTSNIFRELHREQRIENRDPMGTIVPTGGPIMGTIVPTIMGTTVPTSSGQSAFTCKALTRGARRLWRSSLISPSLSRSANAFDFERFDSPSAAAIRFDKTIGRPPLRQ